MNFTLGQNDLFSLSPLDMVAPSAYEKLEEVYAETFLATLYENIVYAEDFECDLEDLCSYKFARNLLSTQPDLKKKICESTGSKFNSKTSYDVLIDEACASAFSMIKVLFESSSRQMIEVGRLAESEHNVNEEKLKKMYSLFSEFANLESMNKDENGSLSAALISEMNEDEKMFLALRKDTFKQCLKNVGVDVDTANINKKIDEEFERNLFIK